MPRSCIAYGCKSGYKKCKTKYQQFSLPRKDKSPERRKKWIKRVGRDPDTFDPGSTSCVCELHFDESSFITERQDSDKYRKRSAVLLKKRLREDAIPTILPGGPIYMTEPQPKRRSNYASTSRRLEAEQERLDNVINDFYESESLKDLDDLHSKLLDSEMPKGFTLIKRCSDILIVYIETIDSVPTLLSSFTILSDFSWTAAIKESKIPSHKFKDILSTTTIQRLTDVLNGLSLLKSIASEESGLIDWLSIAEDNLEKAISTTEDEALNRC